MKYPPIFLFILLLIAPPVSAEKLTADERREKFELWNWCKSVKLLVDNSSPDAKKIGMTKERIQTAVESRLRGARIFSDADDSLIYLYVQVTVSGSSFSTDFYLMRWMKHTSALEQAALGETPGPYYGYAITWAQGITGTHGNDAGHILQYVSEGADNFIIEYLRANAEACK